MSASIPVSSQPREPARKRCVWPDRGYDADWIRELATKKGAWANIPPKSNRSDPICFSPYLYRARNQVERFFNRIKQCRCVATRYIGLRETILPSSNSHLSGYGWPRVMSPRPSQIVDLVWLWLRSPHDEIAATMMRTSEPPHQQI